MLHYALLPAFAEQNCVEIFVKGRKKVRLRGEWGVLCEGEWKRERVRL